MTHEEMKQEKLALQKALIHFEGLHGRPVSLCMSGRQHRHSGLSFFSQSVSQYNPFLLVAAVCYNCSVVVRGDGVCAYVRNEVASSAISSHDMVGIAMLELVYYCAVVILLNFP